MRAAAIPMVSELISDVQYNTHGNIRVSVEMLGCVLNICSENWLVFMVSSHFAIIFAQNVKLT